MDAIDRELAVMRGLASCRGDEERIDEAEAEITRLRADLAASQAECKRLKGELRVIADVMDDAAKVIHTVEGDDYDEDAALRRLVEKLFNLSTRILLQTLDAAIAGKGGA